jgi:catechol 2,3-dioxygenase-like lactoylglutathione lyase family enzyme
VPFDHVTIRVADRDASVRFYETVFAAIGKERSHAAEFVEWHDWSIIAADHEHPVTRNLHVGFYVPDTALADAFWRAGIDAGYADDGEPGPRRKYGDDYYGAFLRDPDGNSVEAMTHEAERGPAQVDHLWIRVADAAASAAFYEAVAPHTGFARAHDEPGLTRFRGVGATFSVLEDPDAPRTEHVHLAFPAPDHATVDAFHAAGVAAGGRDHGTPGERAEYHEGYYGAFVLDPDGHNVEAVDHGR